MKRTLPCLLALLLLLSGCKGQAKSGTASTVPQVVEMTLQDQTDRLTGAAGGRLQCTDPSPNPTDPLTGAVTGHPSKAPDSEITLPTDPATDETDPTTEAAGGRPPESPGGEMALPTDLPAAYQYGDTTPTWQRERADPYPSDENCSDRELLEKWLAVEGVTMEDLDERNCQQLILVSAQPGEGARTLAVCYERNVGGTFTPVTALNRMHGHLGRNGLCHNRRRNTDTTPAGLWAIGSAFGNDLQPEGLRLPWRQVTPNSDWVCDENSIYFNTWQERGDPALNDTWGDDVEHLEDYPKLYAYACVIEFNRPPDVVPHRGCAIFLHCSDGPTGGCVGLPREDMLRVLRWLDAEKNPYILISGTETNR